MRTIKDSKEIIGEVYEGGDAFLIQTSTNDNSDKISHIGEWVSSQLSDFDKKKVKVKVSIEIEEIA